MKWRRGDLGLVSDDGRFEIRKREDRYNLRRVIVSRYYVLWDRSTRGSQKFDTQREAKQAAEGMVKL
jgi:hypothetical protein